jgi:hypothetical protein
MKMSTTTFNHTIAANYSESTTRSSIISRFINWSQGQQENRLAWLGIALAGHGCVITPLTVFAVVAAGNSIVLFMLAIFSMAIVLITNLAAMPTKITIPVFVLSILIDLGILVTCALTALGML